MIWLFWQEHLREIFFFLCEMIAFREESSASFKILFCKFFLFLWRAWVDFLDLDTSCVVGIMLFCMFFSLFLLFVLDLWGKCLISQETLISCWPLFELCFWFYCVWALGGGVSVPTLFFDVFISPLLGEALRALFVFR